MEISRFNLGDGFSLCVTEAGGVAFSVRGGHKHYDLATNRELKNSEYKYGKPEMERGPFDRCDFGDRDRLSWASGACAMPQEVPLVSWGKRYALWFDGFSFVVVDATRAVVVRVTLPIEHEKYGSPMIVGGTLCVPTKRSATTFAIADLEALFEKPSGPLDLHVREHYPVHRPNAVAKRFVRYVFNDHVWLEDPDGSYTSTTIPWVSDVQEGLPITLYDELMKDFYLEYSVNNGPRQRLYDNDFPTEHPGPFALAVEPAIDPAGTLVKASSAVRGEDLDRVFALLADDPDDEAARMVVVDLLEEAGEPYAPQFAKLLAGDASDALRREALGTLTNYIHDVEWHGNLPREGTLAANAPLDDEIGDLVAADHRLGFFHTLRLGDGNFRLYAKLVASPRAVGLRHVDGSRAQILQSLIAANRTNLRQLSGVKFATREVIEALAHPTFDRVIEIETETQAHVVGRLLDYIARDEAKFFARAPRHLVLVEKNGDDAALAEPVLAAWARLPLDKVTIGGVTIARDGTATGTDDADDTVRTQVSSKFRFA